MLRRTAVSEKAATVVSSPPDRAANRPGLIALLGLSAWCGLVAGLLEMATIVVRKQVFDPNQLYGMSRHFVWLIPVTNLGIFLAVGAVGGIVGRAWPRHGRWLVPHVVCALVLLPALLVAFPRIYGLAWLVVALGVAARLVPVCQRHARGFRRFVQVSFPLALGMVVILGASPWIGDRIKQARETGAAPAAAGVVECPVDRVGHGGGGSFEPLWLRPPHQHDPGRARRAGDTLRLCSGGLLMDATVACDDVYGAMVARALGRMAHAAGRSSSHAGGVPRVPGLRDGRLRRQHHVLCQRFGAGPRLYFITRITSSPNSPLSRRLSWSIES